MNKYSQIKKFFNFNPQTTKQKTENSRRAIISEDAPFVVREAYRTTRTNIIFSIAGIAKDGAKMIALTSANPGEGKTTTALNLAITFAQTAKVLIIDCDMRKPRMHRYIGARKDIGLSTVLSKQINVEDAIHREVRPNLDVMVSGAVPPNPAELLASDSMKEMLEVLKDKYEYIFFDTPPVTVVTDASALSPLVDGIMLVVRQNYTDHESLTSALNLLNISNTKILGFFMNDVNAKRAGYGYGRYRYNYGYKYSYKYGYNYGYKYAYADKQGYGDAPGEDEDDEASITVELPKRKKK